MRLFITALAFISSASLSIANVSVNLPYDYGVSIEELSDSTTADNFENKRLELKTELREKNRKAIVSACKREALLLGGVGFFLLITNSSSGSNSSQPWVAVDLSGLGNLIVAIVVGLGGSVLTLAVLITSLVKNKAEYKRSLKKLSNPAT